MKEKEKKNESDLNHFFVLQTGIRERAISVEEAVGISE